MNKIIKLPNGAINLKNLIAIINSPPGTASKTTLYYENNTQIELIYLNDEIKRIAYDYILLEWEYYLDENKINYK